MINTIQALTNDIQPLIEKVEKGTATRTERIVLACLTDCLEKVSRTQSQTAKLDA